MMALFLSKTGLVKTAALIDRRTAPKKKIAKAGILNGELDL